MLMRYIAHLHACWGWNPGYLPKPVKTFSPRGSELVQRRVPARSCERCRHPSAVGNCSTAPRAVGVKAAEGARRVEEPWPGRARRHTCGPTVGGTRTSRLDQVPCLSRPPCPPHAI